MIKRTLQSFIKETSQSFPVLLLCGMRQVGKSTLKNSGKEVGTGAVLCFYESIVPIDENVLSVPVWRI